MESRLVVSKFRREQRFEFQFKIHWDPDRAKTTALMVDRGGRLIDCKSGATFNNENIFIN